MDPITARIAGLKKDLERQDQLSRSLRDEVETLEQLRSAADMDTNAFDGDDRDQPDSKVKRVPLPEEWTSDLIAGRDSLFNAQKAFNASRLEEERVYQLVERNAQSTQIMTEQLNALFAAANWKPGAKKGYVCPISLNDDISQIKKKVIDLYAERAGCESIHNHQTKEMETIAGQIQTYDHIEAELFHSKEEVKIKKLELNNVNDEIKSLTRLLAKKNQMAEKLSKRDDTKRIKGVEGDKRVAQRKVTQHDDLMRKNESSLLVHYVQIQKLEEKLELIGEAIRGDDGETMDRVSADALEDVRKEVDTLTLESLENDKKMQLLDADQEDLEARVRTLVRATNNAEKEKDRLKVQHQKNFTLLDKELQAQVRDTEILIQQTEGAAEDIRSRTQSRTQSRSQSKQPAE